MSPNANIWSRRNVLSPRGLGSSVGGLLSALMRDKAPVSVDPETTSGCWCVSRQVMACEFTLYLPPHYGEPLPIGEAALDEIDRLEDLLTVYRDTSAMEYVNAHAATSPVSADHRLYLLLKHATKLTSMTGGAFDVAIGSLIKAWGFFKGPRRVPDDAEVARLLAGSGMRNVELQDEDRSIRYLTPELEVNLGSIGKGYAIDKALALLRNEYGIHDALMQGGLSSMVAMGHAPGDPRGWLVGIQDPNDPRQRLATVLLRDRAMGTSGNAQQYFEVDGRRFGHVLDPRTGRPAESDLAGASVIARDGATADALATALFVMGLDKAADFCQNHREIGAVLVQRREQTSDNAPPRVTALNLTSEEIDLTLGADLRQRGGREREEEYRV